MDTDGDETIDDAERAAFREKHLKLFDRNNDGKLDRNERQQARKAIDRAEVRRDRAKIDAIARKMSANLKEIDRTKEGICPEVEQGAAVAKMS